MNFLPVTSVRFIPHTNFILSASGNELFVHDTTNKSLIDQIIFPQIKTIHGIRLNGSLIMVYGGLVFDLCHFNDNKLKPTVFCTKQNDFILDCFIFDNNSATDRFCISLAHGGTHFYEICNKTQIMTSVGISMSIERTLLYCCHLFGNSVNYNHLFLAGGSVQNTIMIWKHSPNNHKEVAALSILRGHKGAIFNINVDWIKGIMVSVGDDRSILLWRAARDNTNISFNTSQWTMARSMYGHESRVWGGLYVSDEDVVITWGEDCSVRVWDMNGGMKSWTTPHQGRSIWTGGIRVDDKCITMASGGNDGALVISEISRTFNNINKTIYRLTEKRDFPRQITFLSEDVALVISDIGALCIIDKDSDEFIYVVSDIDQLLIQRYCIPFIHSRLPMVFLGNIRGQLIIASYSSEPVHILNTLQTFDLESKVMLIGSAYEDDIIISLSDGRLIYLQYENSTFIISPISFCLSKSWATCFCFWKNDSDVSKLLCGDKNGHLSMFTYENREHKCAHIYSNCDKKIIGEKFGITSMVRNSKTGVIYIGNKNGEVYSVDDEGLSIEIILKNPSLIGWIARLDLGPNDQLTVLGFKSVLFRKILVSGDEHALMLEYNCGGGHRAWDYRRHGYCGKMGYVHSGAIHMVTWNDLCKEPSVIKPYFHGKEINCCLMINNSKCKDSIIILNGSEDRTLSVLTYNMAQTNSLQLDAIQKFHYHNSSVRCITEMCNVNGTSMIISGGGRGQLVVWERTASNNLKVLSSVLMKKLLSYENDIRIMDLCTIPHWDCSSNPLIAVACSSGYIILLSCNSKHFRLRFEIKQKVSSSCITSISCIEPSLLIACSTDGHLYWGSLESSCIGIKDMSSLFIAKSSLHGLHTFIDLDDSILVSLGGDDGGVRIIRYVLTECEWKVSIIAEVLLAHAGSTVSTRWVSLSKSDKVLASLGSDERIMLWRLNQIRDKTNLVLVKCVSERVGVTDPHSMSIFSNMDMNQYYFYVVGMGARIIMSLIAEQDK